MAEYNKTSMESEQIRWIGSFIIRPARHHKEEVFQLIKETNGFLICGVETITEKSRIDLGKNFTNEDLDHHLEMCAKYEIPMNFLAIADYPRETQEDREMVKKWFIDRKHLAGNPIKNVQLTMTGLLPGTDLFNNIDGEKFEKERSERKLWANELSSIITECGFHVQQFF